MIAAVKGWHAVFAALLFCCSGASAADDPGGAARELARKTATFAGRGAPIAVTWRDLSSLGPAVDEARSVFQDALQQAGLRPGEATPVAEAHLTVSENESQFLLVEEATKGDEREVWISFWKRNTPAAPFPPGISLEKRLLWKQPEQILDVAFPPAGMLVLSPSGIALYARNGTQWGARRAVSLVPEKPWPADLRGHLRLKGTGFQALLPGMQCDGNTDPALSAQCRPADDPWVLESGSRDLLLADFAGTRNYFDGRVVAQNGQRKNVAAFFSAASIDSQGKTLWLLATLDGRVQVLDAALEPAGASSAQWGSDIAGTDAHCGSGSQILATRPGDRSQPDSLQAFTIIDRAPQAITEAVDFPGPISALWASGGTAVTAVVHDIQSQQYVAYVVTVTCAN